MLIKKVAAISTSPKYFIFSGVTEMICESFDITFKITANS